MEIKQIIFDKAQYDALIAHCRRKFSGQYLPEERPEKKAYGLAGGKKGGDKLTICKIFPLKKNLRNEDYYDEEMTKTMYAHGIPSKTPFERRGWVADPQEVFAAYQEAEASGLEIVGSYHMHLVPWPGDPIRDTPTEIDTVLAEDSNMYNFIISLVDPDKPSMRAFYESILEKEIPIIYTENV
ncbi:MAG: hypothetical protein HZA78_01690 [Candidatus Schekmanbacteria bacterium]|nr:hypothetical protein [Candidatus Schekmanbacteria bacterium]